MGFRCHFRDKQEWLKSTNNGINLNTTSDEAAKLYDATVTQLCGWYQDQSLGGIEGTVRHMVEADPDFILGRALELELDMLGGLTAPRLNKTLADRLQAFNDLVEKKKQHCTEQELLHAQVVNHQANNDLKQVNRVLERIVTLCPEDLSALKMNQDTYFFLGTALPMRNSAAMCLSKIKNNKDPLEGYAHGMFAFALEESNMYSQAEREALRALELIPRDTWAIHNYAHCLEMQAKTEEGLKWMQDKKCDWSPCQSLACHQYWHTALFNINNNNFDAAVDLLNKEVLPRCVGSSSSLDLHDAASMVYRMELVDLFGKVSSPDVENPKNRWEDVYKMCRPHKRDHLIGFNDAHYMMTFLGMDDMQVARELIESIEESTNLNEGKTVVQPLLKAMYEFKTGAYDKCVNLLEPIRFEIIKIGGSHAQRDVFEQLLLVSSLKSDKISHNKLGQRMLSERDTFQGQRSIQTELLANA